MLERIWLNCQSIALSQGCRNRALRWHPAPPAMPHWGRSDGIRSNDGMRNQANELRGACRVNPPGSSRRAGGSLPVLRLAAPRRAGVVPCPKKITLWDIVLTSERRFGGPAEWTARGPFSSWSPAAPRRKMRREPPALAGCLQGELLHLDLIVVEHAKTERPCDLDMLDLAVQELASIVGLR